MKDHWRAWAVTKGEHTKLVVEGIYRQGGPGVVAIVQEAVPQGINPKILMLKAANRQAARRLAGGPLADPRPIHQNPLPKRAIHLDPHSLPEWRKPHDRQDHRHRHRPQVAFPQKTLTFCPPDCPLSGQSESSAVNGRSEESALRAWHEHCSLFCGIAQRNGANQLPLGREQERRSRFPAGNALCRTRAALIMDRPGFPPPCIRTRTRC